MTHESEPDYIEPPKPIDGRSPFSQPNFGRKEILSNGPKFDKLETKSRNITFWLYLSLIVLGFALGLSFAILSKIFY